MHFFRRKHRSASACRNTRLASRIMSCRRLPVFVSVAAPLITYRSSASGGAPAKWLWVPFRLIFTHDQSTPYFHTVAVTLVDVFPST